MPRSAEPSPVGEAPGEGPPEGCALRATTPAENPRYRQLRDSGKRVVLPRQERAANRQRYFRRLDVLAADIEAAPATKGDIEFLTTFLVYGTLPYKDPGLDVRLWTREYRTESRATRIAFEAGLADTENGQGRVVGLPYGRYPRLILSWLISAALTGRRPDLTLGPSFTSWMRDALDVTPTGGANGTVTRVRDAMTRLLALKITVTVNEKERRLRFLPVKGDANFWDPKVDHGRASKEPLVVVLGDDFYREVLRSSAPFDRRVQNGLRSCVAIDLYRFICVKQYALAKRRAVAPELVTYEQLEEMFGQQNERSSNFRTTLIAALEEVLMLFPGANTEARAGGFLIRPGTPHITIREKSPRTLAAASRLAASAPAPPALPAEGGNAS